MSLIFLCIRFLLYLPILAETRYSDSCRGPRGQKEEKEVEVIEVKCTEEIDFQQ